MYVFTLKEEGQTIGVAVSSSCREAKPWLSLKV